MFSQVIFSILIFVSIKSVLFIQNVVVGYMYINMDVLCKKDQKNILDILLLTTAAALSSTVTLVTPRKYPARASEKSEFYWKSLAIVGKVRLLPENFTLYVRKILYNCRNIPTGKIRHIKVVILRHRERNSSTILPTVNSGKPISTDGLPAISYSICSGRPIDELYK
jgi:hypothetical protein